MSANRNKESIVLDLKDPADTDVLAALVRRADVLLENFRIGVLDRLGFTVERLHELNPRLVIGSITGFGHDGPEAHRAGYDQIAQGEGGLMSVTGTEQPTKVGVPIADLLAGMNLAYGVVAALHERHAHRPSGASSARRCWPGWSACTPSRAPAGLHRRRGAGRRRRAPPRDRAVRDVRDRLARRCRWRCGSEGLWRRFAAAVGTRPGRAALRAPTATGSPTATT